MSLVWADKSVESRTHLLVLLALADFANDEGFAWPSIDTIAAKSRTSQRSVQDVLGELKTRGKLEIKTGDGPKGTNLYRVIVGGVQMPHPAIQREPFALDSSSTCTRSVRNLQEQSLSHQNKNGEDFPENLNTEAFKAAWAAWKDHRVEIKKKLTPTSTLHQLRNLSKMGEVKAISVIEFTISKGWQGLADPQSVSPPRNPLATQPATDYEGYAGFQ